MPSPRDIRSRGTAASVSQLSPDPPPHRAPATPASPPLQPRVEELLEPVEPGWFLNFIGVIILVLAAITIPIGLVLKASATLHAVSFIGLVLFSIFTAREKTGQESRWCAKKIFTRWWAVKSIVWMWWICTLIIKLTYKGAW